MPVLTEGTNRIRTGDDCCRYVQNVRALSIRVRALFGEGGRGLGSIRVVDFERNDQHRFFL